MRNSPPGMSTISKVILPPLFGVTVSVYFLRNPLEVDDVRAQILIESPIFIGNEAVWAKHKVLVITTKIAPNVRDLLIRSIINVL
jgi:hypothetical protein